MRAMVFEGSAEEVVEALKNLGITSPGAPAPLAAPRADQERREASGDAEDTVTRERGFIVISTKLAKEVLRRRPLSALQEKMLVEIYNAGDKGILGSELADMLDYEQAQFRGMMGAFGRRLVNTEGYDEGTHFFIYEWDYNEKSYRYWLPASVREAVRSEIIDRAK